MSEDFLTEFLACILQEQGIQNPHLVAARAAADLRKAKLVDPKREYVVRRRIRIYELRCSGLPVKTIAIRMNICEALVKREITVELRRRRVA